MITGMVRVSEATYRIVSVNEAVYEIVRILDDRLVGRFRVGPPVEILDRFCDALDVRVLAQAAIRAARVR